MTALKIEATMDQASRSFQGDYFVLSKKSLIDSCDEELSFDDDEVSHDDASDGEEDDNDEEYGDEDDDEEAYYEDIDDGSSGKSGVIILRNEVEEIEGGPCKVRTDGMKSLLPANSLYDGVNQMGQIFEGVVTSLTSSASHCSHPSVEGESLKDQIHTIPFPGSSDTATSGGGRSSSWEEQSRTFSQFIRKAKGDVTKHFSVELNFIESNDTDTTATSSRQEEDTGFVPSMDDDEKDEGADCSVPSKAIEKKARKDLLKKPSSSMDIGQEILLGTRKRLVETKAPSGSNIQQTSSLRSMSYLRILI